MIKEFETTTQELLALIEAWEPKLSKLSSDVLTDRRNSQNRSVKQIVGHMVDSASNNTHRIVHLQYQPSPLVYPDYANFGNNDKWIAIQNYQQENWDNLIQMWKYSNIHLVHVIQHVNADKLENEWITALQKRVTLKAMILDYLSHFKLHLSEIEQLV